MSLFTVARTDLDISKFKNKFSSNLIKELDDNHIININKKLPFFENFINRIYNISIEVDSHSAHNSLLITVIKF